MSLKEMSLKGLEEEIIEIEKIKERFKSGSLEWNNIDAIILEKKKQLDRLKNQTGEEEDTILEDCEEFNITGGICGGDCSSCSLHR